MRKRFLFIFKVQPGLHNICVFHSIAEPPETQPYRLPIDPVAQDSTLKI